MARIMLGWFAGGEDPGFQLGNEMTLYVTQNDVTTMSADVIAVEEDAEWLDNGHVVRWLLKTGGRQYQNGRGQLREQVLKFGAGQGVFSCHVGGDLKFRHVIHVMTSSAGHVTRDWEQHLKQMFHKVVEMADELKAATLILPLLGLDSTTEDSKDSVLTSLQAAVNVFLKITPGYLRTVTLAVDDRRTEALCKQSLSQVLQQRSQVETLSNIQDSPGERPTAVETFDLSNGVKIKLAGGDVTAMSGHAIVVGENDKFNGSGGLASVLLREGGDSYKAERLKMVKSLNKEDKQKLVFFCSAGKDLMFYKILHVLVPDFKFPFGKGSRAGQILEDLYLRVFTSAQEMRLPTLHTPLLGAGKAGADFTQSLAALLEALSKLSPGILREVFIVERDASKAAAIGNILRESLPVLQPTEVPAVTPDP